MSPIENVDEFAKHEATVQDIHTRLSSTPPSSISLAEVLKDLAELAGAVLSIIKLIR